MVGTCLAEDAHGAYSFDGAHRGMLVQDGDQIWQVYWSGFSYSIPTVPKPSDESAVPGRSRCGSRRGGGRPEASLQVPVVVGT